MEITGYNAPECVAHLGLQHSVTETVKCRAVLLRRNTSRFGSGEQNAQNAGRQETQRRSVLTFCDRTGQHVLCIGISWCRTVTGLEAALINIHCHWCLDLRCPSYSKIRWTVHKHATAMIELDVCPCIALLLRYSLSLS